MPPVTHQTVRLRKGKHSSPAHGACVIELASMLAGEPFSDHPRAVSRPIAAFLRGYNDLVDARRRADLYRFAAESVGTAAAPPVEDARVARLLAWGDELWERRRSSYWLLERLRARRAAKAGSSVAEPAASYAVHAIDKVTDRTHAAVLALIDELIAIDSPRPRGVCASAAELAGSR